MPDLPPPPAEPVTEFKPKPSARWPYFAVAGLAAAAAGAWLGDVPNRYHASQHAKTAQIALLSSNFSTALREYREALLLRPMDFELQRQYVDTQARWYQTFERDLEGKTPEQAYAAVIAMPRETEQLLTEPQLGNYRKRVGAVRDTLRQKLEDALASAEKRHAEGEFQDAYAALKPLEAYPELMPKLGEHRRALEINEVRAAMGKAKELAENHNTVPARTLLESVQPLASGVAGYSEQLAAVCRQQLDELVVAATAAATGKTPDFTAAFARLDEATRLKLPAAEAAEVRAQLQQAALNFYGADFVLALAQRDADAARKALLPLHDFAGLPTEQVDLNQLLGDTLEFEPFIATLKALRVASKEDEPGFRIDVHLVHVALERFKDPAPAMSYIAAAFGKWSHLQAAAHRPAIAQALYQQSLKYGAPKDDAWSEEQWNALREGTNLTIAVRPEPDGLSHLGDGTKLAHATFERLKKLGSPATGHPWLNVVLLDAPHMPDDPSRIDLLYSGGVYDYDQEEVTRRSVRYQSGTRTVTNPDYTAVVDEYNDVMGRLNQLQRDVYSLEQESEAAKNNPNLTADQRSSAVISAQAGILGKNWSINSLKEEAANLRARRQSLPRTVEEPVYAMESYEDVKHHHTVTARWALEPTWNDQAIANPVAVTSSTQRETTQVRGNAQHNVPVKDEVRLDLDQLGAELSKQLAAQLMEGKLIDLPAVTWQYVRARSERDRLTGVEQIEFALRIALLWQQQGVTIGGLGACDRALEEVYFPHNLERNSGG